MKKSLFTILQLALVCSCSENSMTDISQIDGNETIKFQVTINEPITKALIESEAEMGTLGFFGYSYDRDKNWPADFQYAELIMYNAQMKYSGSDGELWDYAGDTYYWGTGASSKYFSFLGIAPYNSAYDTTDLTIDSTGATLAYTTAEDATTDLMVANLDYVVPPMGGVVTLNFEHALSSVKFETDDYSSISSVTLSCQNIYMGGEVTVSSQPTWSTEGYTQVSGPTVYTLYSDGGSGYPMLIPQVVTKGDLTVSITSTEDVTTDFSISAMEFEAGKCYTFKINYSYFGVDDDGALVIDLDAYNEWCKSATDWTDYSAMDAMMNDIYTQAEEDGTEVTLKVIGTLDSVQTSDESETDPYHLLEHLFAYKDIVRYDFSEMVLDGETFKQKFTNNTVIKSIKLPVLTDSSEFQSGFATGCTSLETLEFAEGSTITTLPQEMCSGCTSLTSVNLTALTYLIRVSQNAFLGCTSLESITIPKSVVSVEYQAFKNCSSLETVKFESGSILEAIAQWSFSSCSALTTINIPATVNTIGYQAFYNCTSLYGYDDTTGSGIHFEGSTDNITIDQDAFDNTGVTY